MARGTSKKTPRGSTRSRWTPDDAREVMAAWEQSGLTMAAFCRQRQIRPERFYWWRSRLAAWSEAGGQQALVRVHPAADETFNLVEAAVVAGTHTTAAVAIHLDSGDRIEVITPSDVDAGWLLQIARGLRAEADAR